MASLFYPSIVLASASASRKAQLKALGFTFTVQVSGVDEDPYKSLAEDPKKICQKIARAKAKKVAGLFPKALVLAGDQMAVLKGKIFNKTPTQKQAFEALMKLQGQKHHLLTALHICYGKKSFAHLQINTMHMRELSPEQVLRYVKAAKPIDCAGSYALERKGIGLFQKIQTADQSAVVGFPLIVLINQLIKWKIALPFL